MDLAGEYNNRARVPDHPAVISRWHAEAKAYREATSCELDIAYGALARNRFDFFPAGSGGQAPPGQVTRKPEVMDDFLRNFFVKMGLARTCEAFEAEWYELKATGKLDAGGGGGGGSHLLVPDVYQRNADLEEEVAALRKELGGAKSIASQATATWDKFRKERDFHRMHHKRVAQEKNKLLGDIKRLKVSWEEFGIAGTIYQHIAFPSVEGSTGVLKLL